MAQSPPTQLKEKETWRKSTELLPSLTCSSGPLTEELQCSVCLDAFTNPVTIPCGHNFCKSCLNQCWDKSEACYCPLCKEKFSKRPDLKINTALRQVVQLFKEKPGATTSEVVCDICDDRKLKALKSCLVCQSSYCETHLEPHHRVPRLKKHKLVNAVENLEDYICEQHQKTLELFCRDDQTPVCPICTVTDHKNHNTVPLEQESVEKKTQVMKTQADVQQMIQDRMKKIQDIKHSAQLRKQNMEKVKVDSTEFFAALMRSIERCEAELLEKMEEKEAEKREEALVEELRKEIAQLKRRDAELEKLSHTEDHLHFMQNYSSMCRALNTKLLPDIRASTPVSLNTIRAALTQLQQTLDEKLSQTELKRMRLYAVDVTLDPDTAHPNLILSDDGKQVSNGDVKRDVPDTPERFDHCVFVLGKEGFSSGRFYFEVQVNKTGWNVGVARESVVRKGRITLTPQNGYWVIWLRNEDVYKALGNSTIVLSMRTKPQKIGVFVDYEEGLVSFYDVKSRSHIYSFTGQTFNGKLHPYLCPLRNNEGKNSASLIISPVDCNE
ncbi:E3 ubiquitin-protein ligase TRIM39-like [Puntigrus tetrazona]|uniref:E3 ubiquitin-protein ligase TRIM39-like n=1 Tax=Puntigrus tetrazona TaxID=1606681 RepID=UPI001C8915A6|nr:E3 ubiquitin-protein ligase TRIM39-like [Puntigrus tetrazona]XP_043091523.1 E3 ubiquitin-protein ligase TRIM39-like [Puntigrus tetrazona]